jgi:hypothetical protein
VSLQLVIERLQTTAALLDSDRTILATLPSMIRSFTDGENYRSGERRFHPFAKFVPYRKSCTLTHSHQIPTASDAPPHPTSRGLRRCRDTSV